MSANFDNMSADQAATFLEKLRDQGSPFIIIYEESASMDEKGNYVSELGAMIEQNRHFDYVGVLAMLAELGGDVEGLSPEEMLNKALEEVSGR